MKQILLLPAVTALFASSSASAAIVALNFADGNPGDINDLLGPSGFYWNGVGANLSEGNLQLADNSGLSGISLSSISEPSFARTGEPTGVQFTANGYTFTAGVMNGGISDNFGFSGQGRDGLISFKFTAPVSAGHLWSFTLVGGDVVDPDTFVMNVGGLWDTGSKSFSGGISTASIDPDDSGDGSTSYGVAILENVVATQVGDNYEIILQIGSPDGNNGNAMTLRGLVVTTAIPEPSTYAMIGGLLALGLAVIRRRRDG